MVLFAVVPVEPGEVFGDEFWAILQPAHEPFVGVDQSWAGAVEVLIAVDEGDAMIFHGGQLVPPRLEAQGIDAFARGGEVHAAGADDEVLGLACDQQLVGHAFAFAGEAFAALRTCGGTGVGFGDGGIPGVLGTGAFDKLDGPVAGAEKRVGPLEEGDDRAIVEGVHEFVGVVEAFAQADDGVLGALFAVQGAAHGQDVVEDGFDGLGVEADDLRRFGQAGGDGADGCEVNGADFAEVLGQDDIRSERGEAVGKQGVKRLGALRAGEGFAHLLVDCCGLGGCDPGRGEDGQVSVA